VEVEQEKPLIMGNVYYVIQDLYIKFRRILFECNNIKIANCIVLF